MSKKNQHEGFIDRIQKGPDCWMWTGSKGPKGYGYFAGQLAHRYAHEIFKGAIPRGYDVDHVCRNRACVNPEHLEAVTHKENIRRAIAVSEGRGFHANFTGRRRGRYQKTEAPITHCKHGHEYNEQNTIRKTKTSPNGSIRTCRECRTCKNIKDTEYNNTKRGRKTNSVGAF